MRDVVEHLAEATVARMLELETGDGSGERAGNSRDDGRAAGRRRPHLLDPAWVRVVEQLRAGPLASLPATQCERPRGAQAC